MKYYGLSMEFGGNHPEIMVIHTYKGGALQESYTQEITGSKMVVEHEFPEFDTIVFEFMQAHPNNDVIVNYVKFGDVSDYEFNYHGLKKTPVGIQVDKYRDLRVQMVNYYEVPTAKNYLRTWCRAESGTWLQCLMQAMDMQLILDLLWSLRPMR